MISGREMKIEHYRQGVKIRDITNDPVYSYDSPVTYKYVIQYYILPLEYILFTVNVCDHLYQRGLCS